MIDFKYYRLKTKILPFITIIITGQLLAFLASCKSRQVQIQTIEQIETPPGVVTMQPNFYIDQTEITNFSYLEFAWWTGRVYGQNSEEYKSIYPDSNSWTALGPKRTSFLKYYRHPDYRNFPVVSISYEQAKKFSKWRSDRVMEYILIRERIIKHRPPSQTHLDSVFSIERYFTGKYYNIAPHPNIQYYPEYGLPDTSIYSSLLVFADSLNSINNSKCKDYKFCDQELFICNCKENKSKFFTSYKLQSTACYKCKKPLVVHLKGNALELTNIRGLGFGGSFNKSCNLVSKLNFFSIDSLTFDVSFRNTCVWRKWQ